MVINGMRGAASWPGVRGEKRRTIGDYEQGGGGIIVSQLAPAPPPPVAAVSRQQVLSRSTTSVTMAPSTAAFAVTPKASAPVPLSQTIVKTGVKASSASGVTARALCQEPPYGSRVATSGPAAGRAIYLGPDGHDDPRATAEYIACLQAQAAGRPPPPQSPTQPPGAQSPNDMAQASEIVGPTYAPEGTPPADPYLYPSKAGGGGASYQADGVYPSAGGGAGGGEITKSMNLTQGAAAESGTSTGVLVAAGAALVALGLGVYFVTR